VREKFENVLTVVARARSKAFAQRHHAWSV